MLLIIPRAHGQGFTLQIDENGNGLLNGADHPGFLQDDPGPGGLANALTYTTPAGLVAGDLYLDEPDTLTVSDLIRWNNNATLVFYSEIPEMGENPDIADIGLAMTQYPPVALVWEEGSEGNNGYTYIPSPGGPGYDPSNPDHQPTYIIISDIPEPGTVALVGLSLVGFLAVIRHRK
ncbi:MAG: PEP-CTERM sorting domain-containing protein [Verrucomicrobiia bacterium]